MGRPVHESWGALMVKPGETASQLFVRLLGPFQLWSDGNQIRIGNRPKLQALLVMLGVRPGYRAGRDTLLTTIWPDRDCQLSGQALNSLTSSLRRTLQSTPGSAELVVHDGGFYRLNVASGVGLDVARFEQLAQAGVRAARQGDIEGALSLYGEAIDLYRGDLCAGPDINSVVERERLRALNMNLLARIADHQFSIGDSAEALQTALRLLAHDPCREDAHRVVMRSYVSLGQRAQALRQFRLCEQVLRQEFGALPETETRELFEQVRLNG
jgi:DNA-binding SARP family transcriptional activator